MLRHLAPETQRPGRHGDNNDTMLSGDPPGATTRAGRFSFFSFPAEIRNMIYDYSLQRPDCGQLYRSYYKQGPELRRADRPQRWRLGTPTILLLCKRITGEGMPMLMARWFVIDRLPPCMPPLPDGRGGFLRVSNFIRRETLQKLQYIDLRIGLGDGPMGSGWIWNRVLDELLGILSERNALVHFRLLIRRCNQRENLSIWPTETREEWQIKKKINSFQISNPNVFKPAKVTVETWRIDGQKATFVDRHHQTEADETSEPPSRSYPDRELFPGSSIMQFVDIPSETDSSDEDED